MIRISTTILIIMLGILGCTQKDFSQPKAMLEEDLKCPDGSISVITRWGGIDENGWAHSCKMVHGKYHVWRDNILAIEGQYSYGKKESEWTYRDKSNKVTKIILYKNGKKVSEVSPRKLD